MMYLFILHIRKGNLFQTFLQFQTVLCISKHVSSHHDTVHKLCKVLSYLNKKNEMVPIEIRSMERKYKEKGRLRFNPQLKYMA